MSKYYPTAHYAGLMGVEVPTMFQKLKNAGVPKNAKKEWREAEALEAIAVGQMLDKSKAGEDMAKMESAGVPKDNIIYKSKQATFRRIVLQGDLLEIERDKMRRDLIPMQEHKEKLLSVQNISLILVERFIENVSAKRRDAGLENDLRELLDAAKRDVLADS